MVHYSKVINGIVQFIDCDMVSKMAGSWKAWGIGAITALVARRGPEVFERLRSNQFVQSLGLIEGEMIDIDSIYAEVLKQSHRASATVDLPFIGSVTYTTKDVEQIYRMIVG